MGCLIKMVKDKGTIQFIRLDRLVKRESTDNE